MNTQKIIDFVNKEIKKQMKDSFFFNVMEIAEKAEKKFGHEAFEIACNAMINNK